MKSIKAFSYANYPDREIEIGDVIDDGVVGMVAWVGEDLCRIVWASEAVTLETHNHVRKSRQKWDARDT